jgi:hypothetical protein
MIRRTAPDYTYEDTASLSVRDMNRLEVADAPLDQEAPSGAPA